VTAAEWGSGGAVDTRSVFWNSARWNEGGDVSPGGGPARWTTSFDVLDGLLRNVTSSFPSLQLVTMVGFSAGAQLASRYAWASPLGVSPSDGLGVRVRFVVSDPGTFLYLDAQRPAASCRPLEDDGEAAAGCTSFQAPTAAEDCDSDYDQYKYGLQNGSLAYHWQPGVPPPPPECVPGAAGRRRGCHRRRLAALRRQGCGVHLWRRRRVQLRQRWVR